MDQAMTSSTPGNDNVFPDEGKDVIYGGDGNDMLASIDRDGQDKLYCGAGRDRYFAENSDYVDSSCETASAPPSHYVGDPRGSSDVATSSASASPVPVPPSGGPAILPLAAALLLGSGILTYAILGRR
jgi:RTX calcium-binding nonapeptide repeat (4 copies)